MDKFTREQMDADANELLAIYDDIQELAKKDLRGAAPTIIALNSRFLAACTKYRDAGCTHETIRLIVDTDKFSPDDDRRHVYIGGGSQIFMCRLCAKIMPGRDAFPANSIVVDLNADDV